MRILLDTHIFLWLILDDPRLPEGIRTAVEDGSNQVFVSTASIWESVIKHAIGKLPHLTAPETYLPSARERHRFESLPIDEGALPHLARLGPLHKDPFDRILVAQTIQHGLTLASVDDRVRAYPVPLLPAR